MRAAIIHPSLRAIVFDFNGVIAEDETPHFLAFQQALGEDRFQLTKEDYYGRYLGMDERNCLNAILTEITGHPDPVREQSIHERKAVLFRAHMARHTPPLFPGVVDLVAHAGQRYRLAIATGGRREQILFALSGTPIEKTFDALVSAEDVAVGKPYPDVYLHTLDRLNETRRPSESPLVADECLVIEDSLAGITSALAAGMKVLAVATTY
nr:HAD family phosphatase [Nitrospirales bacterium]